jgi:hypothetical protein
MDLSVFTRMNFLATYSPYGPTALLKWRRRPITIDIESFILSYAPQADDFVVSATVVDLYGRHAIPWNFLYYLW